MLPTPLNPSVSKPQTRRLGSVLQDAGLVSPQQLKQALQTQALDTDRRIGEILAEQVALKPSTVNFFVDQLPHLRQQKVPKRLGQYLQAADLLNEQQIAEILHAQEESDLRFGEISVNKGWLRQDTVDFFLCHLQADSLSDAGSYWLRGTEPSECPSVEVRTAEPPILLSPPHLGSAELQFVNTAFQTNWIAPAGPNLDAFEQEFCQAVGISHAAALSSGTAAIHLALKLVGVGPGDEVLCSTLTFVASANPILYLGASPVFIDSDRKSWNMDPQLLREVIQDRAHRGKLPKAVILVHLYGQSADIAPILEICNEYGVPLIEDAAESLGATYQGQSTGTFGRLGIFSFNGNKIITTSGGGMLVSEDAALIAQARFLATQARDLAPHYQHSHMGFNYRLSNVLAGIGRGQLRALGQRVAARCHIFQRYREALGHLPGLTFMPEPNFGQATHWLSCLTINPSEFGCHRNQVQAALRDRQIESRPVWKPLHLQPLFAACEAVGGTVAEALFQHGLCLPSGSSMTETDQDRVISTITSLYRSGA